ncbi:MAG: ATP-dependent DNA helicase [Candidatus Magasanikbacteria bacterium CG_4_10_14_0_2_um_filter_33_14]|uniref:DNA 3'-5' helicase n=1 Tax=Candidatus Magasanikbacteria bacterium CG_4_10_14_0_2_um_filter_33_14 TaxID=1974636 RepID=A0A2M7V938_9BACT|nr:MAG: ATP-dependent DNA helicase [Candidatus Magasanikbacteria bacterium CG_4_10_14_0_2_um_filter_33_14]
MPNFAEELNQEQLEVIHNGDGPCLVLAGAGSGKTRTITYRVAYLLEHGVEPDQILLLTFTNKAAKEMTERVSQLTGGKIKMPWSGTFHRVAYKLLRQYAPLLGYKNNFSILDSEDSRDMLKICIKQEGVDRKERRFPSPNVIQSIISYSRNAKITVKDVLEQKYPNWVDLDEVLGRIAQEYSKRKLNANVMDFDDLLVNLFLLLYKNEHIRKKYSEKFRYVLVDEYQDTNKIQASVIELFASHHKNILVVGDDAQSIYSFRAADIQNILDFEKHYPDAKIYKLETNYRSTPEILSVANEVIANNKNQYKKELRSVIAAFTKPEVHAFSESSEEAEFIAERILELREEGVELNKIAVLFRAAFHSQALEMELAKRDIPYDYRGGTRFFERAHVKDVLAYLRIINNKDDSVAWSRVLNMQVGIGPVSAEKVYNQVSQAQENINDILPSLADSLSARGKIGWSDFLSTFQAMQSSGKKFPSDLIRGILKSKYLEYLESEYPDYRERLQDLEQLAVFADRYLALEESQALDRFLGEASLQENYNNNQTEKSNKEDEQIVLSTVHQAKGLEWDAVFILNVSAGQFPNERSTGSSKELEEERRLFYVAITRARKYLYITYPLVSSVYSMLQGPSMFLEEIDNALLEITMMDSSGSSAFFDPSDDEDDVTYEPLDEDKPAVRSFLKSLDEL